MTDLTKEKLVIEFAKLRDEQTEILKNMEHIFGGFLENSKLLVLEESDVVRVRRWVEKCHHLTHQIRDVQKRLAELSDD